MQIRNICNSNSKACNIQPAINLNIIYIRQIKADDK